MFMKNKLKLIIIDNVFALLLSLIIFLICIFLLTNNILPILKVLWGFLLFVSFGFFMYNLCVLLKIGDFSKFETLLEKDIEDLSDGKIDGMKNGKKL